MGRSHIPGPAKDSGLTGEFNPAPGVGVGVPGPEGMQAGGACGGRPRLRGWPRTLSWDDFPEIPARPSGEDEDAQIRAEAMLSGQDIQVCREGEEVRLGSFQIRLVINEGLTWAVRGQKTEELRHHEQGHFNLAGLMARQLMNAIAALRESAAQDLLTSATALIQEYGEMGQGWSDDYDTDTDHSRVPDAQARWDEAIQSAIDNETDFRPPGS